MTKPRSPDEVFAKGKTTYYPPKSGRHPDDAKPNGAAHPEQDRKRAVDRAHPLARFVPLASQPTAPITTIPGFVCEGLVVIAGQHGIGKTTALTPLALAAAGIHGPDCPLSPGKAWRHVIYISEDIEQLQRILMGAIHHGTEAIKAAMVVERFHMVEAVRLPIEKIVEVAETYIAQFTRVVMGVEVLPLVVIDTKSAVIFTESEDDNAEASKVAAALKQSFLGMPVWLVGHVAKANFNRNDPTTLSIRGASSLEGDGNQTLFLVAEGEERFICVGKVRFEPKWKSLAVTAHTATTTAHDRFGDPTEIRMRWATVAPSEGGREAAAARQRDDREREEAKALNGEIVRAIREAWEAGSPLTRSLLANQMQKKRTAVFAAVAGMVADSWLHEIEVPARHRVHPQRKSFLIQLTTDERRAFVETGRLPPSKEAIPPAWKRPDPDLKAEVQEP